MKVRDDARPVSLGRTALAQLVKQHGSDTVAGWLRDIETAPVKRRRGRPKDKPYYDDTPLLQAAAARWRQTGSPASVWPALLEAGRGTSGACRLLRRLDEWNIGGCAERDIADFYLARRRRYTARWRQRAERDVEAHTDLMRELLAEVAPGFGYVDWRGPLRAMPERLLGMLLADARRIAAAERWSTWDDLVGGIRRQLATYKKSAGIG